ncbi:MAG: hypothetical protein A4E37_02197 [Methanoregulaceae archaeon PtaB.Bin056]|jgi:hypothetical protein|nr:MAG: hypothetical protein A4E37_02197 [Methanoregulaceae archaeon PtaB.Bin056]
MKQRGKASGRSCKDTGFDFPLIRLLMVSYCERGVLRLQFRVNATKGNTAGA